MNLFTADVGQGKVHIYDSGNDIFHGKIPQQNLIDLNIPGLKRGDTLVVEDAHLRESHKLTLAQPFDWNQLNQFKENSLKKGITILLFPQKSTPKARKLIGIEESSKSDEVDTKAIAEFLLRDKNAFNTLKQFTPKKLVEFQEQNQYIFDYIRQSNDDINEAKSSEYGLSSKFDYEDEVSKWIIKYAVKGGMTIDGFVPSIPFYLNYDEELLSVIGIEFDKKGKLKKIQSPSRIYTLVHSILRPNGELRVRTDVNKVPNWKFIKAHYLGCKPYHMKQGVAASNYKHWMRKAVSEYVNKEKKSSNSSDFMVGMPWNEYFELKKARTKVDKMTQQIWYALRKMIVEDGLP